MKWPHIHRYKRKHCCWAKKGNLWHFVVALVCVRCDKLDPRNMPYVQEITTDYDRVMLDHILGRASIRIEEEE